MSEAHGWMGYFVSQGEELPRGYGVAWRCWDRDMAVVYPVLLNIVFGWARTAYLWLCFKAVPRTLDRRVRTIVALAERDAYARGYERASQRKEGFRAGWEAAFAKLETDLLAGAQAKGPR